jgi:hypothetical protein
VKTDELISMLAAGAAPVDARAPQRRIALALAVGAAVAVPMMFAMLGLNPQLGEMAAVPMFWIKVGFSALLAFGALLVVMRLGRPGMRLAWTPGAMAVPLLVMWSLAAIALLHAAPGERGALVMGSTWSVCPYNIAVLAAPALVAALWAMRGMAPTRPALAGGVAGFLAGAVGALVYTLHCPELAAPFLGLWYLLGMLIPAAVGAVLGPLLLRW